MVACNMAFTEKTRIFDIMVVPYYKQINTRNYAVFLKTVLIIDKTINSHKTLSSYLLLT